LFNQDLEFDMTNVVDISSMFRSALSFEGKGLERWNVKKVQTVQALFEEAMSFSGLISGWKTENAIDMSRLFHHATSFTDDLSGWYVRELPSPSGSNEFWFCYYCSLKLPFCNAHHSSFQFLFHIS